MYPNYDISRQGNKLKKKLNYNKLI